MNRLVRVRVEHEWAVCVVIEADQKVHIEGDDPHYAATFMAYSSYGTYGHYWSSMGCPFGEFAARTGKDYLLSKLSTSRPDLFQYTTAIRRMIKTNVDSGGVSETEAKRCRKILNREEDRCIDPNTIIYNLCNNMTLVKNIPGFEGISCEFYPHDAINFVDKIWPAFVTAYNDPATPLEILKETANG